PWADFISEVRHGKRKLDLSGDPAEIINDTKKGDAFINSCDWFKKGQEVIAKHERIKAAKVFDDELQTKFVPPKGWKLPDNPDMQTLDAWFSDAVYATNLLNRVNNYAQAYHDLKKASAPGIDDQMLKELRDIGVTIEIDPKTDRIKLTIPMP